MGGVREGGPGEGGEGEGKERRHRGHVGQIIVQGQINSELGTFGIFFIFFNNKK